MSDEQVSKNWLANITTKLKIEYKAEILEGAPPTPFVPPPIDSGYVSISGFQEYSKLKKQVLVQPNDMTANGRKLYHEVSKWTKKKPIHQEGRVWAGKTVAELALAVGISTKQVHRYTGKNPFRHATKRIEGVKMKLLRIGEPGDLTNEDFARMMVKIWRKKTDRMETSKEFGLLVGMAKDTPSGLAPDIFCTVIENWSGFMAGVHLAISSGMSFGDEFDTNPNNFEKKFFHHPSISVTRRFWPVAKEHYLIAVQGKIGKGPNVYTQISSILLSK
ncbi:hypothetical protein [Aestuariibius sp. HNIBRBA575]|uniref:hypothetical protein n=1 Tax=Aestuariibius sp. HNIBRBA575 TaxID=3233343 RepID=UPI0034A47061